MFRVTLVLLVSSTVIVGCAPSSTPKEGASSKAQLPAGRGREPGLYAQTNDGGLVLLARYDTKTNTLVSIPDQSEPEDLAEDVFFIFDFPGAEKAQHLYLVGWKAKWGDDASLIPRWFYETISPDEFPKLSYSHRQSGGHTVLTVKPDRLLSSGVWQISWGQNNTGLCVSFLVDGGIVLNSLSRAARAVGSGERSDRIMWRASQLRRPEMIKSFPAHADGKR